MNNIENKFTTHFKNSLTCALLIVKEFKHTQINIEHLLYALILEKGSVASEILYNEMYKKNKKNNTKKPKDSKDKDFNISEIFSLLYKKQSNSTKNPKLSKTARQAILKSVTIANIFEHKIVATEHLLLALTFLKTKKLDDLTKQLNINLANIKIQTKNILKSTSKFQYFSSILDSKKDLSIFNELPQDIFPIQSNESINPNIDFNFKEPFSHQDNQHNTEEQFPIANNVFASNFSKNKQGQSALKLFTKDLTDSSNQAQIDPVIGREKEIQRLAQILCRRRKNNPMLLGDPGVGKTAIVEGLAKKIITLDVPEVLLNKKILALDLSQVIAGTIYRGEFEQRLKQIIDEIEKDPNIILFIDEIHTIIGAGANAGSLDAANILKPALARGEIKCIGATTFEEYRKHIESDPAFERRFQPITIIEPTKEKTANILQGLKENYEKYHNITITNEAIKTAVYLSDRYIQEKFLPDKAIDLIDETASKIKIKNTQNGFLKNIKKLEKCLQETAKQKEDLIMKEQYIPALKIRESEKKIIKLYQQAQEQLQQSKSKKIGKINSHDIAQIVSQITGIDEKNLISNLSSNKNLNKKIIQLEKNLKNKIIGQDKAIEEVTMHLSRSYAGIASPNRPIGSFIFIGPSGVGKTMLAKELAKEIFQDSNSLIRIDMSEFSESFNISKLIGAPAGYVGYKESPKLTESVKRKPYSIILFDEIEKAHPDVFNLLLQILEDGHLTDASGTKVNFKNTIIIMTSNIGSKNLTRGEIGFNKDSLLKNIIKEKFSSQLKDTFNPEFLNRLDKIIYFNPLCKDAIINIVSLEIQKLNLRLKEKNINIFLSKEFCKHLVEISYSKEEGARLIKRNIQNLIENQLAEKILKGEVKNKIAVELYNEKVILN